MRRVNVQMPSIGSELLGRGRELDALRARLESAIDGRGGAAMLIGEAGIGKTRLAEEIAVEARARSAAVLWGRCLEGEGAPPFWPWVQVLRAYVADVASEALLNELGSGAPDIAQLLPALRERWPNLGTSSALEPALARVRLFDSVTVFLKRASRRRPIVIILDDLHWADAPSLLLVEFLAHELRDSRVLLVGACRDAEKERAPALRRTLAELTRVPNALRLSLGGLGEHDVGHCLAEWIPAGVDPTLVSRVHRQTDGNPLFVVEIARYLASQPEDAVAIGKDPTSQLPPSVRDLVRRRLGSLSPRCEQLLAVAAVIGREFFWSVAQRAAEMSPDGAFEALEEAENAGLVCDVSGSSGVWQFTHVIIRDALYQELPATARIRLHRAVGDAMEEIWRTEPDRHLAELSHHWFSSATAGRAERAVDLCHRAGQRAIELLAFEESAQYYAQALQALELVFDASAHLRCELTLSLADARSRAGDRDGARDAFARAAQLARELEISGAELLAQAALGYAGPLLTIGVSDRTTVTLLEEALERLGPDTKALRARLLARLALELYWSDRHERRIGLARESVSLARTASDPVALAYSLFATHWALWSPSNLEERLSLASELVRLAERHGDRRAALQGYHWRIADLLEQGDIAALDADLDAYARLADELRDPLFVWYSTMRRGMRAHLAGRLDDAERLARRAMQIGQRSQGEDALKLHSAQLFLVRREQGRLGELEGAFMLFAEQIAARLTIWRCGLAIIYAETGKESEARALLDQLGTGGFQALRRDMHWLVCCTMLAEASVLVRDLPRVETLFWLLQPFADRWVTNGSTAAVCWGPTSYFLGVMAAALGRPGQADEYFARATHTAESSGARGWLAHCRYQRGANLLPVAAESNEPAMDLIALAAEEARALGMAALAQRAESVSVHRPRSRSGAPDVIPVGLPNGLSEREAEVLRLIAAGKSNRQIAAALTISTNTVLRHVSNIFDKTAAANRAEAASFAVRHGLAD